MFLNFLKDVIGSHNTDRDGRVWRVKFTPRVGVSVSLLDKAGTAEVEAGEDRVGFLPRWYWDGLENDIRGSHTSTTAKVPLGWQI